MNKIIILVFLLSFTSSILYADNNITSERVNAVSIFDDIKTATHVSFTIKTSNDDMDIEDITLTHYLGDEKSSKIKITKATNCSYPKDFIKTHRKDKSLTGIIQHGKFDAREIIIWCDDDIKFNAVKIIPGSKLEEEYINNQHEKRDKKQPLSDGKVVMFYSAGYVVMAYEDVTHLSDPNATIMARLTQPKTKAKPEFPRGSGPAYSLLNKPAPVFTPKMFDKNKPNLEIGNLKGKVWVMVNYASWCKPCEPFLTSLTKAKKTSNAIWVGVNYDTDEDKDTTSEMTEGLFDYLLNDTNKEISTKYQITGLPSVLIINKAGVIIYHTFGTSNLERSMTDIAALIDQLN